MGDTQERMLLFADFHYQARVKAHRSQDYMAAELGVAKKTIQNWEKGVSAPSFLQSIEWFRVLNINPFPYYLAYVYPDELLGLKGTDSDQRIDEAFDSLVKTLPMSAKRSLLYFFYGEHGSSPNAMLQLILAYLHTPIKARITQAVNTAYIYELEKELGNDICKGNIQPDMELLNGAILRAKTSIMHHETGYGCVDKDE